MGSWIHPIHNLFIIFNTILEIFLECCLNDVFERSLNLLLGSKHPHKFL